MQISCQIFQVLLPSDEMPPGRSILEPCGGWRCWVCGTLFEKGTLPRRSGMSPLRRKNLKMQGRRMWLRLDEIRLKWRWANRGWIGLWGNFAQANSSRLSRLDVRETAAGKSAKETEWRRLHSSFGVFCAIWKYCTFIKICISMMICSLRGYVWQ